MRNFITILVPLVFLCSCLDKEPQDASEVRKEMLEVQDQMIAIKKELAEKEEKIIEKNAEINSIKLESKQKIDSEIARLNLLLLNKEQGHKYKVAKLKSEIESYMELIDKSHDQNKDLLKMLDDSNSSK